MDDAMLASCTSVVGKGHPDRDVIGSHDGRKEELHPPQAVDVDGATIASSECFTELGCSRSLPVAPCCKTKRS